MWLERNPHLLVLNFMFFNFHIFNFWLSRQWTTIWSIFDIVDNRPPIVNCLTQPSSFFLRMEHYTLFDPCNRSHLMGVVVLYLFIFIFYLSKWSYSFIPQKNLCNFSGCTCSDSCDFVFQYIITFLCLIMVGKETNRGRSTGTTRHSTCSGDDLCQYG